MAGKTEWDDQMIRLGHMKAPEPTVTEEDLIEMIENAAKAYSREPTREEKLEKSTLEELDELEDEEEDEVLDRYRQKRIQEMKEAAVKNRYGKVLDIKAPEWKHQVTEAPKDLYVVVHLYKSWKPECQIVGQHLDQMANKHKGVKFLRAISDETIPNYPDKNVPTILVYKNGDIQCQMIGLKQMGGKDNSYVSLEAFEFQLAKLSNAFETDLDRSVLDANRQTKFSRKGKTDRWSDSDSDLDL
mmetsp:Transcript_23258/g.65298  ORF Transcript_23258/g.65298 Transcript_23258/m.65298 type:complete len:243 (+) Transcript_23258:95-823(+)